MRNRLLVTGACALFMLGCGIGGSSPDPDFYVLYPHQGPAHRGPTHRIELRRPKLPEQLERRRIVRGGSDGRLLLSPNAQWGASPTDLVASTLVADLAHRLPNSQVYREGGAISAPPDLWVELNLDAFQYTAEGEVVLDGQFALHPRASHKPPLVKRFALSATPPSDATAALVATMSDLLSQLANLLADEVASHFP